MSTADRQRRRPDDDVMEPDGHQPQRPGRRRVLLVHRHDAAHEHAVAEREQPLRVRLRQHPLLQPLERQLRQLHRHLVGRRRRLGHLRGRLPGAVRLGRRPRTRRARTRPPTAGRRRARRRAASSPSTTTTWTSPARSSSAPTRPSTSTGAPGRRTPRSAQTASPPAGQGRSFRSTPRRTPSTRQSDDGVRLWVNDQLVVDNWTDHGSVENSGTIALTAGQQYTVRMEYYENGGSAVRNSSWSSASQAKQIIPPAGSFRRRYSRSTARD